MLAGPIAPAVLLLSIVVSACASRAERKTTPSVSREPSYDAAAEWQAKPARAAAPTPALRVAPSLAPAQPPPELRELTDEEITRFRRVQRYVHAAAREHDLPPDLINGIIWVESKFETRAKGHKGPKGLMQVMPRTGRWIATKLRRKYQPFSADFNIHAGTYYFASMVRRYQGNLTFALVAYHRGPAEVDQWARDDSPLPEVSRRYVENVFRAARAFRMRDYASPKRSRPAVSSTSKNPSSPAS